MAVVNCGIYLVAGYGLGISTLAVVYALKKLRGRSIVRKAVTEIKQDEAEKRKRIAEAKKDLAKARKLIDESERDLEREEEEIIENEEEPKPKRKLVKKKKEQPKDDGIQRIELE